jgi:hypothetical protein
MTTTSKKKYVSIQRKNLDPNTLTYEYLKEHFVYDETSSTFLRYAKDIVVQSRHGNFYLTGACPDEVRISANNNGKTLYIFLPFETEFTYNLSPSRVVWCLNHKCDYKDAPATVRHKDGNLFNNNINNLTTSMTGGNPGVYFNKRWNKFVVRLDKSKKTCGLYIQLGKFNTQKEAENFKEANIEIFK